MAKSTFASGQPGCYSPNMLQDYLQGEAPDAVWQARTRIICPGFEAQLVFYARNDNERLVSRAAAAVTDARLAHLTSHLKLKDGYMYHVYPTQLVRNLGVCLNAANSLDVMVERMARIADCESCEPIFEGGSYPVWGALILLSNDPAELDHPSAYLRGYFHPGSTLFHELLHVRHYDHPVGSNTGSSKWGDDEWRDRIAAKEHITESDKEFLAEPYLRDMEREVQQFFAKSRRSITAKLRWTRANPLHGLFAEICTVVDRRRLWGKCGPEKERLLAGIFEREHSKWQKRRRAR